MKNYRRKHYKSSVRQIIPPAPYTCRYVKQNHDYGSCHRRRKSGCCGIEHEEDSIEQHEHPTSSPSPEFQNKAVDNADVKTADRQNVRRPVFSERIQNIFIQTAFVPEHQRGLVAGKGVEAAVRDQRRGLGAAGDYN